MEVSMQPDWMNVIVGPFQQLVLQVMNKIPGILAAILLLLVGMLVARASRAGIEKFLKLIRLDEYTDRIRLNEVLARLGFGRSPGQVVGFLVYWLIILVFLLSAANAVELTVVSELLQQFVLFIPKVIGAVLVLAGGLLLGHLVAEVVHNAAIANRLDWAVGLSKAAQLVVIMFASIMALEQIDIDTTILTSSIQIVLATVGLGFALAFGLGGRDKAAEVIRKFTEKQG
jgi:hypothetical protein